MEKDFLNPWHFKIKQERQRDVIHLTEIKEKNQSTYKTVKNIMIGPHHGYKTLAKYFILFFLQNQQFN